MSDLPSPCLDCGEVTTDGPRCAEHRREHDRTKAKAAPPRDRSNRLDRYGARNTEFKRLSKQARQLQPFCSACNRTADQLLDHERLETDHLPSAYAKYEQGKPLTLNDVDVLCSTHNNRIGSSAIGTQRYEEWSNRNGH